MNERTLFLVHRVSAGLLVPFIIVHLVGILLAVRGGLTAAEILGRTRGSFGWGGFYALFVALAVVHGSIGMRNVLRDWTLWRGRSLDIAMLVLGAVLLLAGLRAVAAVVA